MWPIDELLPGDIFFIERDGVRGRWGDHPGRIGTLVSIVKGDYKGMFIIQYELDAQLRKENWSEYGCVELINRTKTK